MKPFLRAEGENVLGSSRPRARRSRLFCARMQRSSSRSSKPKARLRLSSVQTATAEGIRLINESMPSDAVLKIKSSRGICRSRQRQGDQDHHPQRDPGHCRPGRGCCSVCKGRSSRQGRVKKFNKKTRWRLRRVFLRYIMIGVASL